MDEMRYSVVFPESSPRVPRLFAELPDGNAAWVWLTGNAERPVAWEASDARIPRRWATYLPCADVPLFPRLGLKLYLQAANETEKHMAEDLLRAGHSPLKRFFDLKLYKPTIVNPRMAPVP